MGSINALSGDGGNWDGYGRSTTSRPFYFIIAILDYFYQRFEHMKSLKMSKKEIKDEYKRLEGDPMIKQRQRDAQRQMPQGRQMGAVLKLMLL